MFQSLSGETHLLDLLSAAILEEIASAPATTHELVRRVAARFGVEPDSALRDRVATVCQRFDELGLAEPVGT